MSNTIINPTLFSAEVIRNRDIKNVFYKFTNSDYTGELRSAGDTVTVQILPTLSFSAGTAGAAITATDFTITTENLVIDNTQQLLVTLTEKEKTQSNLQLTRSVAERFAEAEARLFDETVRDQILVTQIADIPAANKLYSGAPITLTPALAYTTILNLSEALDNQNVDEENRVAFVSPNFANNLMQSGFLDASDKGLETRFKGYIGMVNGVKIVKTNALSASKEVIMMQEGAVNMVVQLNNMDVRRGTDGFYENVLAEVIFGLKIFGENAKAIAVQYIA
jgi:N4-gp56 family major capsid protein